MTSLSARTRRQPGEAGSPRSATRSATLPGPHELSAAEPGAGPLLRAERISKSYRKGDVAIPVLRGVNLQILAGQFTAVVGQSGSGKSTLLHVLATLDAPDSGAIFYQNRRIDRLPSRGKDALRNRDLGMVFQFYHLLPELTTLENVLLPSMIGTGVWTYLRRRDRCRARAQQLLEQVGLSHRLRHKPRELSGGEMQRVAIARALMPQPKLLLADEPTGNLDRKTGREIMDLLRNLNQTQQLTIVMVTHDGALAGEADRTMRLVEGAIADAA